MRNTILRRWVHLIKLMLRLLNLIHAFCISRIHELLIVIKVAHVHLVVLEFIIVLILIFFKIILIIGHAVLVLWLALEIRGILIIKSASSLL